MCQQNGTGGDVSDWGAGDADVSSAWELVLTARNSVHDEEKRSSLLHM
jgi:hypothetical protein